jgi:osmoprotectant transport system substrate-binding protein
MLGLLVAGLALVAAACSGQARGEDEGLVVGVGSTQEQRVLAALTVVALEQRGLQPEIKADLGGTSGLRREAIRDNIDLFWDYTGAAWALGMGQQAPPADPRESLLRVRRADRDNGLVWLQPSEANATFALFVRKTPQAPPDMGALATRLSAGGARLCADPDFVRRPGGLRDLAAAYAIDLERLDVVTAKADEALRRVADGECLAALATATSGKARQEGLARVTDDLAVFPAFVVAPVIRSDAREAHPAAEAAVNAVAERVDTASLAALNARVDAGTDVADLEALAERFLARAPASEG